MVLHQSSLYSSGVVLAVLATSVIGVDPTVGKPPEHSLRPPHLVIVQDVSASIAARANTSIFEAALFDFLELNAVHLRGSSVKVIQFGSHVELAADRTIVGDDDIRAIIDVLREAERADLWTETTSALATALNQATAIIERDTDAEVLIIFLTDGLFDPSPSGGGTPTLDELRHIVSTSPLRPREQQQRHFGWP